MRKVVPFLFFAIILTCAVAEPVTAQNTPVVPRGITGYYYNNAEPERASITGPYYQKTVDPKLDFRTATLDWKPFGLEKRFSVYWNGWLYIAEKRYYGFSLLANGGAELYIDDIKLVKKTVAPNKRWESGTPVLLEQGYHRIEVIYFNWSGSAAIGVYWDRGEGENLIPNDMLFPEDAIDPVTLGPKE